MESVRKGLRSGDVEKDSYGRLSCTSCEEPLGTENDPDEIGKQRVCPECGTSWTELS